MSKNDVGGKKGIVEIGASNCILVKRIYMKIHTIYLQQKVKKKKGLTSCNIGPLLLSK